MLFAHARCTSESADAHRGIPSPTMSISAVAVATNASLSKAAAPVSHRGRSAGKIMTTVRTRSCALLHRLFFLGGIHRANDARPPQCSLFDESVQSRRGCRPARSDPDVSSCLNTSGSFNAAIGCPGNLFNSRCRHSGRGRGCRTKRRWRSRAVQLQQIVGRSGATRDRSASLVASALTRPSLMNPSTVDAGENITWIRPEIRSITVCPLPGYNTPVIFTPAICLNKLSRQMRAAAEAGCTVEQLIWLLFGEHDELSHILDIETWMNNEDVRDRADEHNWHHVPFNIGTLAGHQCRVDRNRYRGKQKRVTVLGAARDIVSRHHAAGAWAIFHNYRLLEQFCELVADDAGGNVAARARAQIRESGGSGASDSYRPPPGPTA